jgi:hypothetical protein
MHIKTAFVASTLPARFLLDNLQSLNITRLICGSESLKSSYHFLNDKFTELEILSVPSSHKKKIKFLLEEVKKSKLSIVIFHECCWIDLDISILKVQPNVEFYPCVTLESWKKLGSQELRFLKLIKKLIIEKNINVLKLIYLSYRYMDRFDIYEMPLDDQQKNKHYQLSLKESRVLSIKKSNISLNSRLSTKENTSIKNSKNIILILATDVVENKLQLEKFYMVIKICQEAGFNILIKNHPNPIFRLNIKKVGRIIPSHIPIEVFEEPYFIKIGLFSSGLAYQPKSSISIADLFSSSEELLDRRKHLLAIPGGSQIKFIKNYKELEMILK